jgi:ElaB/YqjD/DUF883 family membrane-anchored ribosome-binding protein
MSDMPRQKEKIRDKLTDVRDHIADVGHIAKEAVTDSFQSLRDRASTKYDEGKEKLGEYRDHLAETVRESPMKSVLIAAGIGLALGFLWRRS